MQEDTVLLLAPDGILLSRPVQMKTRMCLLRIISTIRRTNEINVGLFSYILYVCSATILLHDKVHMYPILDKFMASKMQFSIFNNF